MLICSNCQENEVVYAGKGLCRSCYDKQKVRRKIKCAECGRYLPHAAFGLCRGCNGRRPENISSILKRTYGITLEEYDKLFEEQKGVCWICQQESTERLCVDHAHDTGQIRGLLCRKCNLVIGNADEDVAVLNRAIDYLRKNNAD